MKRIAELYEIIEALYNLNDNDIRIAYGYITHRFDFEEVNADGSRSASLLQIFDNASCIELPEMQALKDMIGVYIKLCASAEDPEEEYLRYIIKVKYIPAIITLLAETADFMTVDLIFQLLKKGAGSGKNVESDI